MRTTVAAALKEFDLISGVGSESEKQACAMSLLAWLDECDTWTDHPRCAHPVVASWVIQANDHPDTTKAQRAKLVRLGLKGVLDTWWIPGVVLAEAVRLPTKEVMGTYERTAWALNYLISWKKTRPIPDLSGANLSGADLSGVNLSGAYLSGANLSRADLSGVNLSGAYLSGVNLSGADLSRADLSGVNLSGADLSRADLFGANLSRAYLSGVNLSGADLSRANLSGANLSRAYLFRADLSRANLSGANLSGANLSGAIGTPSSEMPAGWKLVKGLWVKETK